MLNGVHVRTYVFNPVCASVALPEDKMSVGYSGVFYTGLICQTVWFLPFFLSAHL